jgi:hypothetical protein
MNNRIDLATAKDLIKRYRENLDALVSKDYTGSLPNAETFDASAIQAILNQQGCVEFRAYYGMKEDKTVCLIFIGVDAQGNDIINSLKSNEEDVIVEFGRPCPPYCNDSLL